MDRETWFVYGLMENGKRETKFFHFEYETFESAQRKYRLCLEPNWFINYRVCFIKITNCRMEAECYGYTGV